MKVGFKTQQVQDTQTETQVTQGFIVFRFSDGFSAKYPIKNTETIDSLIDEMCQHNITEVNNDYKTA